MKLDEKDIIKLKIADGFEIEVPKGLENYPYLLDNYYPEILAQSPDLDVDNNYKSLLIDIKDNGIEWRTITGSLEYEWFDVLVVQDESDAQFEAIKAFFVSSMPSINARSPDLYSAMEEWWDIEKHCRHLEMQGGFPFGSITHKESEPIREFMEEENMLFTKQNIRKVYKLKAML